LRLPPIIPVIDGDTTRPRAVFGGVQVFIVHDHIVMLIDDARGKSNPIQVRKHLIWVTFVPRKRTLGNGDIHIGLHHPMLLFL